MSNILKGLQLNELSTNKLAQYKTAASADAKKADSEGDCKRGDKRFSGIVKATKKEFANDAKKVKEDKWNPITGGDFPTDYTSGDTTPSPAKFQAMLDYHGNNMNVIRALEDLYRNAQSGSYYDSTVRADRYLATIENRFGKSEKRYFPTKREAYQYAKGYNSVVTSIEKIDKEEDTSDLITLPVMLGIKDHKKKWMLKFPSEDYAQKWEFKHKNVAKILWDEQHALYTPEPEAKPETEKDQEDDEPGKYGYDTETGKPLKKGEKSSRPQQGTKPQQASRPQQYNTSQQVGYTKPSKYSKDDVTDVEVKEAGNEMIQGELMPVTRQYWQKAVLARYPDAKFFQQKMMNGATIARDESGQVGIYDPKNSYAKVGPSDESNVEEAYNNYHANRTGFSRGQRDDERHDLDKPTQVWGLKINGKVWSKGGADVTFTSKQAALNARNAILKNKPDLEIGLVTKGGVAEGEGNFAGDTPVNLGGDTVKRLQVGDIVKYFGQKAKILAMSKTGNTSRITIANDMGGVTKDVLTSDLKRTGLSEEELDENLNKWFKEKWVRFGPDGKIRGDCARGDDSEGKPKCLPQSKAHSLGKKGRASAASRKRREDPNPERSGKAINVNTKKTNEEQLDELSCWSGYHRVAGTKAGFPGSCAKNKTNEEQHSESCPHCGGEMVSEELMNEKKDACYYKVKSRYKVWPSAYASGALVKCRKSGASNWGTGGKSNESVEEGVRDLGYDAQSLIMKLRRDVEEKRLQPTPQAVLAAARELAGDMNFAPQLLVQQVLGKVVAEDQLDEKWTKKYKDSINCSNPKGFSQKAHCAGKQKNESAIMKGLKL